MTYTLVFETRAKKEFFDLPRQSVDLLRHVIDDLENNPRPSGAKKLSGADGYRVRKGDYRVLYTINDKDRVVTIYRIGHRKDVYRH